MTGVDHNIKLMYFCMLKSCAPWLIKGMIFLWIMYSSREISVQLSFNPNHMVWSSDTLQLQAFVNFRVWTVSMKFECGWSMEYREPWICLTSYSFGITNSSALSWKSKWHNAVMGATQMIFRVPVTISTLWCGCLPVLWTWSMRHCSGSAWNVG